MTTRAEFVSYARARVGVPTLHQGRHELFGLDCAGLLIVAAWHFELKPRTFDVTGYPARPDGVTLRRLCDEHLTPIAQDDMQTGDVLLVRWQKGPPQHLGILFDHPFDGLAMVHADNLRAKAVAETRVKFGRAMGFVAAYSVPGLT